MRPDYETFFQTLACFPPYPYQQRLATQDWPDLLDIPTGLGKTAAVAIAWLYRHLSQDAQTPRRLVYCLPMRVLVEQTLTSIAAWLERSTPYFQERGLPVPTLHLLMGGDVDRTWTERPEVPTILVGTQDMLLSRALMRGYGMSRFQWPVDYALLHNDALWVYDEVQLMGPGLVTTAQLEAFRRALGTARPSRSLWVSATLNPRWLETVDFHSHTQRLRTLALDADDWQVPGVLQRVRAAKRLKVARVQLTGDSAKRNAAAYAGALAAEVRAAHRPGTTTLVILNQVSRAQAVFQALCAAAGAQGVELLLVHARFRPAERRQIEARLRQAPGERGRIIVATQAIEAGVDISAATLFTELAPWSSLVQRFGRNNRYGEVEGAVVFWIDTEREHRELSAPYDPAELDDARRRLEGLTSASAADLPPTRAGLPRHPVIRRKDLLQLFDTDPDLSGFDVDVSVYIRDSRDAQVQVAWRDLPADPEQPVVREELCPVSLAQFRVYLDKKVRREPRRPLVWDSLEGRWVRLDSRRARPGLVVLLPAGQGGYDSQLGFLPDHTGPVPVVGGETAAPEAAYDSDWRSQGQFVELAQHLCDVEDVAGQLCGALGETVGKAAVTRACRWHDTGKAHPAFQNMLLANAPDAAERRHRLWAKGAGGGRAAYFVHDHQAPPQEQQRPHFRHELASMLAWLDHHGDAPDADLIAYLVLAHHGKVRLRLRALPGENVPQDNRRHARGIWEDDQLPGVVIGEREVMPPTTLQLGLMDLGQGGQGASWVARSQCLLDSQGPFRLAWLETLVRIADWRASAREQAEAAHDL